MTFTQLIEKVRIMVDDDEDPPTADDTVFALAATRGARYIFDRYPDSRLTASATLASFTDVSENTPDVTLCVSDEYTLPMLEYMAYAYFSADAGDTRDAQRASEHYKRFRQLLREEA